MKNRPFRTLLILIVIVTIYSALIVRTFERTFKSTRTADLKGFDSIINCVWLISVTMTTVGYGDYYVSTHMGRVVGVVVCLFGMIIVSLGVIFMQELIQFTAEEQRGF